MPVELCTWVTKARASSIDMLGPEGLDSKSSTRSVCGSFPTTCRKWSACITPSLPSPKW